MIARDHSLGIITIASSCLILPHLDEQRVTESGRAVMGEERSYKIVLLGIRSAMSDEQQ